MVPMVMKILKITKINIYVKLLMKKQWFILFLMKTGL